MDFYAARLDAARRRRRQQQGAPGPVSPAARAWHPWRGEVGAKRCLPAPRAYPPPKRRSVSARRLFPPGCGRGEAAPLGGDGDGDGSPRFRVARADGGSGALENAASPPPPAGSKGGVLFDTVSPTPSAAAAATSVLKEVSAADGAGPVAVLDEELEEGEIAPEDYPADGNGVPVLAVNDLDASASQCGEKRPLRAAAKHVDVMNNSGGSSCNVVAESLDASASQCGEMRPLWAVAKDVDVMNNSGGSSCNVVAESLDASASRCGEKRTLWAVSGDVDMMNKSGRSSCNVVAESLVASATQCGEERPSWAVAKDLNVMNKSGGSSCNVVAEPLAEDHAKVHLTGKKVSESARMDRASSDFAAGVSGEGTIMRRKVMFTPRKSVKPIKMIQESALDTQCAPFSKDKEKETELETRVTAIGIEDSDESTKDLAVQALMSADKFPMTQGKETATSRGFFGPKKKMKVKVKSLAHFSMKVASALGRKEKMDDKVASNLENDDILKALAVHEGKLELYLNSSTTLTSMWCQRQSGVQNGDARSKFKMMCRWFEFICRALVQAVEQHSLKIKRIDLEAGKVIRRLPGFTKPGPIVGKVPGVEVGDEFLYRVQLAIVGLHRVYQGGIDTTKDRNGMPIAISIVCSGGYPDELSSSGELIYTGSGGKPAGRKDDEDQKLERGNLALKNCIRTKTPVRVIHGFKGQNREGGSHSRAKQISTFTYDGLYHVVDYWREGQPGSRVFKYILHRIPGQPELPLHIAKGMRKSTIRPGLCVADISQGKEGTPICVINTVDDVGPAPFRYITRIKSSFWSTGIRPQGCDCNNGCSDSSSCTCAVKNGGEIPFNLSGAIVNEKPLIFECGPSCKCPPSCHNRVSQHGMKIPLEVFRTTKTGWGVRSLRSISSGSFICEYVGELLDGKEADQRRNNDYLFDIGRNYDDENRSCSQTMEDMGFTIDAAEYGNIGRFFNHSCSPNIYAQNVLWDHNDERMPHIMLFAAETIPPLQELTYDYNYKIDRVHDVNGRIKFKCCRCGSPQCCGRLY